MLSFFSAVTLLITIARPADAQGPPQSSVTVPRLEMGASVSFAQRFATPVRNWTGPGLSLTSDVNVTPHLALAAAATTLFDGRISLLAGARISTGFYYGNNRDPVPGRFVGRVLAGSIATGDGRSRFGLQLGGGADVLFKHPRGLGAHWEVGYRVTPGAPIRTSAGYAEIGVILGPRLR